MSQLPRFSAFSAPAGPPPQSPPPQSPPPESPPPFEPDSWPDALAKVPTDAAGPLDALTGNPGPNATYLGERLLYEPSAEAPFDPVGNPRYLSELWKQVLSFVSMAVAVWFGAAIIGFISAIGSTVNGDFTSSTNTFFAIFAVGNVIVIILAIIFWLRPFPALLSEWKISVDGRAAHSYQTLEHMVWALRERHTPVRSARVRRISVAGGGHRDTLILHDGIFVASVSSFAYGDDLYIGWTLWLHLSPIRWQWMSLTRFLGHVGERYSRLYASLDFEPARALREALHAVAHQGVDAAVGNVAPQGQGIIGREVAVDSEPDRPTS